MPIRYELTPVALYGQLGRLAGAAQAAREQQQQIAQQASQIRQMQHQTAMAEFQAKLDLQAEMRARQWELQKAEINSQYSLQEQLRTETMYRDRDIRKRMEREDNAEKALKELGRLWGDKGLLTPANRAVYDSIESKITAEKYGFDITVPSPRQPAAIPKFSYEELAAMGYRPEEVQAMYGLPAPEMIPQMPQPPQTVETERGAIQVQYQKNPETGQIRMSSDGGKTWQIIG